MIGSEIAEINTFRHSKLGEIKYSKTLQKVKEFCYICTPAGKLAVRALIRQRSLRQGLSSVFFLAYYVLDHIVGFFVLFVVAKIITFLLF